MMLQARVHGSRTAEGAGAASRGSPRHPTMVSLVGRDQTEDGNDCHEPLHTPCRPAAGILVNGTMTDTRFR